jgi:hypothetical protein
VKPWLGFRKLWDNAKIDIGGYPMIESDNRRKKFYLDYGVNPTYIGMLLTAIIAVLAWANGVDKEQAITKTTLTQHSSDDKMIEKRVDKLETLTDERLTRMEAKMDRLIEGQKRMR